MTTELSYASANPTDIEHLRILGICYYVLSGITAFFACFPLLHVAMGIFLVVAGPRMGTPGSPPPPAFIGWIFIILGSIIIVLGWTLAVLTFLAGRFLAKRRKYTYCVVIAALVCLQLPFGTVLGVFSFIVLLRPSVKPLFSAVQA